MKKYMLSTNCIIVTGFNRDAICDTQNNMFYLIKKAFSIQLGKGIFDLENLILDENSEIINILLENDVIFEIEEKETSFFISYDFHFELPCQIHNAIIDIHSYPDYDIFNVFFQLEELQCRHTEIRFFEVFYMDIIEELVCKKLMQSTIETIDIHIPFSEFYRHRDILFEMKLTNLRLHWLYVYNTPVDFDTMPYTKDYLFIADNITNSRFCGNISPFYFMVNPYLLTESVKHNSCLNLKISIDSDGNIKNCPSMSQPFGNVKDTTLQEALNHPDFKKYWNVTKDQIAVCKDCEFRYICTDCRAYIENPEDMYSKPLKCGYNPYTCEWEEWSTNPLKQKAIDYYGMREILPEFKIQPDYVPTARNTDTATQ